MASHSSRSKKTTSATSARTPKAKARSKAKGKAAHTSTSITRTHPSAVPRIDDYPDFLTIEQLQHFLQVGRSSAYSMVRKGAIPTRRFGRHIRIPLRELVAQRREGQPASAAVAR